MPATPVDIVGDLSALAQRPSVELAIEAMREFLGMDVAYASEITGDQITLHDIDGDGESFNIIKGLALPSNQSYCQRILAGRLPNVMPDVRGDERTASMPITRYADIGAFTSVPLTFSDGRLYGTLCAASHDAKPSLGYRELQFLHVFARIVADQLEREEIQDDARDSYTAEHSQAVVAHAVAVAAELGLCGSDVKDVELTALLHDIGKIAIPDVILRKKAALTDGEWDVMRTHPISGERLIANVPALARLGPMIRAEHERWDGDGYPDRLVGEQIPLASRITLVCDAYHAMTSERPYRKAMSAEGAKAEIAGGSGTQFCPTAAAALLGILDAAV